MSIRKNRIKDILEKMGFRSFKPTDQLLHDLQMSRKRFFQIIKNEADLTGTEIQLFASWLWRHNAIDIENEIYEEPSDIESIKRELSLS